MADVKVVIDPVQEAIADAVATVVAAVATAAGSAVGQSTSGAQGTVGGAGAEAGLSTQGVSGEVNNKFDVSVPEAMESMNLHALKDVNLVNKALVGQAQSNAKLYDVTATALGLAVLTATHHNGLQQQMASDHRDQNHDRQINVNETDAYSVLSIAAMAERLRNPTP